MQADREYVVVTSFVPRGRTQAERTAHGPLTRSKAISKRESLIRRAAEVNIDLEVHVLQLRRPEE